MTTALRCPNDGMELGGERPCRRCGARWLVEDDLSSRAPQAFARMAPAARTAAEAHGKPLACPQCAAPLVARQLSDSLVLMYRCAACAGWLCPRGTIETLEQQEKRIARELAFASFSPAERAEMARDLAAATASPDRELGPVHKLLALCGLPVVTRTERMRLPVVTWSLVGALVAVFIAQQSGGGLEASVARLSYGPEHSGVWAALRASFAHAGWFHLLGNVYFLAAFGDVVEQRTPRLAYAAGFVVIAALAIFVDGLAHPQTAIIGASGGVAAVVGACVVLQPRAQVAIGLGPLVLRVGIVAFAIFWAAFQMLMALLDIAGTAWLSHLAGLTLGVAVADVLRRQRQRRQLSPNQVSRS
jgi:membrane associated rhomboid family serine protease